MSLKSVEDVVSLCVVCREDASVLLTIGAEDGLARFFTSPVVMSSWRLTARKLIGSIGGLSGKDTAIMRITKFWMTDAEANSAFHVIYKLKCPLHNKKNLKLQGSSMKWFSLEHVQVMCLSGQLISPELLEYVSWCLQPRTCYPLTTDPEANKEGFDILNEVIEKNTLIDVQSAFPSQQEQLLKLANFTNQQQKRMYKEFLNITFPYRLMNKRSFEKFVEELGWKIDEWPDLFSCIDVFSRGGIGFKDFIVFLAATEPQTPHGKASGEIRCQYIFRYFDRNKDNVLDFVELRALIKAMSSVKATSEIDKVVYTYMKDLGLGQKPKLTMDEFIKKVGELKFKGTSSVFRSLISVLKNIPIATLNEKKPSLAPEPQTSTFTARFPRGQYSMASSVIDNELLRHLTAKNKVFQIATHAIKLSRSGLLYDIRPIDRVSHGKSVSLANQDLFIRHESMQYYNVNTPANELLRALEFFTNENLTKSKHAYSWGRYDMDRLISMLLIVCEQCIKILENEPRMTRLSSPVYILGDLHGNYRDLMAFEQILWSTGLALTPCSLLFLGDYVDRGPFGVEIVAYLFAQKLKNPNQIFLLRGNHEIRSIQKVFTFYTECQRKFGEGQFYDVWNAINRVFDVMPLAAVIDDKLFCCHGGIPPPWLCARIDVIDTVPCPLACPDEESVLAWEIMWNDPVKSSELTPSVACEMEANEGFAMNVARKTGRVFSLEALDTFLKRNELSHVIRAHEVKTAGFQVQQGGRLLTVFSSSGYCGGPNEAACILVSHDKIRILHIDTTV